MGSLFAHLALLPFYWLFPGRLSLFGLLIGSLIMDIDAPILAVRNWRQSREIDAFSGENGWRHTCVKEWYSVSNRPLHNLLGAAILFLPAAALTLLLEHASAFLPASSLGTIFLSVSLGLLSHHLIDLPAHFCLRYLTPWERPTRAPFLLFKDLNLMKAIYPFLEVEEELGKEPYAALPLFNYLVLSNLLPVLTALFTLLVRRFYS